MLISGTNQASPVERGATLSEQVADAILRGAIERRIPFGTRLVEAEIARELNVSRVPVREALRLLYTQGLVENQSQRGMCLISVTNRVLEETLTVRHHLETLAVTSAVQNLESNQTTLDGLQAALEEMKVASASGSATTMAASDVSFHRAILQMTNNQTLLFVWETLARKFQVIVGIAWYSDDQKRIYEQHVELLKLFKKRDLPALLTALKPHIMEGLEIGAPGVHDTLPESEIKSASLVL